MKPPAKIILPTNECRTAAFAKILNWMAAINKKYPDMRNFYRYPILNLIVLLAVGNCIISSPALAIWTIHEKLSFHCPLSAKETKITDNDKIAIRIVIQNQIDAFKIGDGERAFSYASSGVKQQFNTPADFFNTLKSAYESVLIPRSMVFEDLKQVMGIITQPVLFFASDGDTVMASYVMEKEESGDWKISGCYLAPIR